MSKAYKVLPNHQCPEDLRFKFEVKCGSYAKFSGYGLCPGICIRVNQIHEDKCKCIYDEKPYCLFGEQSGLDANCTEMVIPMPGCYVAYICAEDEWDPEDFAVYMDTCTDLENLQTVLMTLGHK